jgi:hypothetical protein
MLSVHGVAAGPAGRECYRRNEVVVVMMLKLSILALQF